ALERQRVERPRELVRLVGGERLEVEVLVDEDAVHGDPDRVTGERQIGALAGHCLYGPRVAADHADLAIDQPASDGRARPGTPLVELGVVLLPELAVPGPEQHGVALPGLANPLSPQRRLYIVHRDHVADGQTLATLDGQHVEEDAAREEGLQLLDADLLDPVRSADLLLREAVVVTDLAVARHHADVTEAVELRADLADLTDEQLVVVVELVIAEGAARGCARQHHVRAQPLAEQRDALLEHATELIDLARLDEVCR